MANLPETPQFDEGIYQIETVDPVVGGPNGVSNESARGLANRTRYLKNQVDALNSQKAPLHSPNFTGAPQAPTPGISDSSAQIATTGWVAQRVTNLAAPAAHVGAGGNAHPAATTSTAGFMSASDKQKLDGIAAGAQANTVTSVAGKTGAVTLSIADVAGSISPAWLTANSVASINGKTGRISKLSVSDVEGVAPLNSPRFTGSAWFAAGENTSAFSTDGYFNHNHKYNGTLASSSETYVPNVYALKRWFAPRENAEFTGHTKLYSRVEIMGGANATAPMAALDSNDHTIATTNWVRAAMENIVKTQGFVKGGNWVRGFIRFPTWLGSLTLQWVHVNSASTGHNTVQWPLTWANECTAAIISPRDGSSWAMGVTPALASFSWECPTARNGATASGTVFGIGW